MFSFKIIKILKIEIMRIICGYLKKRIRALLYAGRISLFEIKNSRFKLNIKQTAKNNLATKINK